MIFPRPEWEKFSARIAALPMEAQWWKRIFLGNAMDKFVQFTSRDACGANQFGQLGSGSFGGIIQGLVYAADHGADVRPVLVEQIAVRGELIGSAMAAALLISMALGSFQALRQASDLAS